MINNITRQIIITFLALWVLDSVAIAANVRSTKHNLSITGPGTKKAASENQVCKFCHIPHGKGKGKRHLWNRKSSTTIYTPYYSSTLDAEVGQPTGSSRMCLSCHDGTIALGAVSSNPKEIPFMGGLRAIPEQDPANRGTDLTDDHPVSMVYDSLLARKDTELKDPSRISPLLKLEENNQLQCVTCHNPHDDAHDDFLVMDNKFSAMCVECHVKKGWNNTSHATSEARLKGSGRLWRNNDYKTVAENGCENCHTPHNAGSDSRLLYHLYEEDNCLSCHDGSTASTDIESVITKRYNHPVGEFSGVHDASEDDASDQILKHVECVDCHNPHQSNDDTSPGGNAVSGAITGVPGISAAGQKRPESIYSYEICFKCHGDNSVITVLPITRQIEQFSTRKEFDPANPSFHPVLDQGRNHDVPSLISPLTTSSIISCADCHGPGDASSPKGPHGSDWKYLLTDNYLTEDYTEENASSYALCYQCHSRTSILNDDSFMHSKHVSESKTPCSVCHDPHGVSYEQGNDLNNSHLINFDLTIVFPDDQGRIEYNSLGTFQGECFLNCHGTLHNSKSYP